MLGTPCATIVVHLESAKIERKKLEIRLKTGRYSTLNIEARMVRICPSTIIKNLNRVYEVCVCKCIEKQKEAWQIPESINYIHT